MILLLLTALLAWPGDFEARLGRTQVRVTTDVYRLTPGRTLAEQHLEDRLGRLDYQEVSGVPEAPGTWSREGDTLWVYRRAHYANGRHRRAKRIGVVADADGRVTGGRTGSGREHLLTGRHGWWLEPEILSESLNETRAPRILVRLDDLPEHVWAPLLALEDDRFFEHAGVSGRAIARAAFANARAGEAVQGGSTITQQLVKNRDLTPRRGLDRKASEAVRALYLEAHTNKEQILQAYLNTVYYGHVEGVAIHGLGTAARVYFSKDAADLTLPEAATLAAVLQGPNALHPLRHPDAAKRRRDRALTRMEELSWITSAEAEAARATPLTTHPTPPSRPMATALRRWVRDEVRDRHPRRAEKGKGFFVQTTLDPWVQARAEHHVERYVRDLPRGTHVATVVLDERGRVLAYVGGDPASPDALDRVRGVSRQPGSTMKPFALLEAFDDCGPDKPLHPATLVSDAPLTVDVDGTPWSPRNYDREYHGRVSIRHAMTKSYNIPLVRISEHCGRVAAAQRATRAGMDQGEPPPPSWVLGTVETSPLALAGAYTVLATLGRAAEPWAIRRISRPKGLPLSGGRAHYTRVASGASTWLVRDVLTDVVEPGGTGTRAAIDGVSAAGKTGTTSGDRDAWFAGQVEDLVAVVWLGRDDGSLGRTGGSGAAPLWGDVVGDAVGTRPVWKDDRPPSIVDREIDPETGLVVGRMMPSTDVHGVFRRGAIPRSSRWWRKNVPARVIE